MSDKANNVEGILTDTPILPIESPPAGDEKSATEKRAIESTTNYEKDAREKEHQRGELLKGIVHRLVVGGIIIVGILMIAGIVIWAWHILTPTKWHWLLMEKIYEIQKIMSSALLAIVVGDYAKKYLK